MGSSLAIKLACVVAMCMVVSLPYTEAAITCGMVTQKLAPCLTFLQRGGPPAAGCCGAIKSLNSMVRSTPDRKAACGCLKSAAKSFPGINMGNAAALPGKCGVNIGYPISTSVDCSRVK
uniref:Non-specific lipid-transfer protein n=1 Tax=Tamarix hispida TaxID=189793 RepID=C0KHJ8_9CARY|nr:lipid transfer protein 1 [Tamarix hispida]